MDATQTSPDNLLSYAEAADHVGLHIQRLYRLVRARQIPHVRLGPRTVFFKAADLDAWIDGSKVSLSTPAKS
jgi:excisionase family DNA binding protein